MKNKELSQKDQIIENLKTKIEKLKHLKNENKKLKETARDYETTLKMQNDLIYQ